MAININPAKFVLAQNSAMWIHKATDDAMKIMGLQGMGLALGFSQQEKEIPMMGERISPKVFTGASYDAMTVNNNFIEGDPTQEYLRNMALSGTMIKPIRLYTKDGCHFSAPDQPNSTSVAGVGGYVSGMSGLNVGNWTDPQAGAPSDTYTNSVSFAPGGPFAMFIAHAVLANLGDAIAVLSEATNVGAATIELVDNTVWDTLGFEDGDTIIVDYNGATPKYAVIASGSNTDIITLELEQGDSTSLADGNLTTGGAVHGASPSSVGSLDLTC